MKNSAITILCCTTSGGCMITSMPEINDFRNIFFPSSAVRNFLKANIAFSSNCNFHEKIEPLWKVIISEYSFFDQTTSNFNYLHQ